jgi:alcohol sulfotransferase
MTSRKKINNYAARDVPLYDFVIMLECGLPKIIEFMNVWDRELGNIRDLMVIRY